MRRGHPGLGGWRGDNPRHFRPRGGDSSHFRPPRNYSLLDTPRFPPAGPGVRLHRGPRPYNAHPRHTNDRSSQDYHSRNNYREVNLQNNPRLQERNHHPQSRNIPPLIQRNSRQKTNTDHGSSYREASDFYDDVQTECHVNMLGDVDHRQPVNIPHDSYGHKIHTVSPWSNPPPLLENKKQYYENRSPQKSYHHHEPNDVSTIPVLEYGGHRPPSSDHYGGNLGPMVNNNNSFSRSVDDTVDIVRRRLMNRNDSQRSSEEASGQSCNDQDDRESISQHIQEEPPVKKRIQRQRTNAKSNCDHMKSKIVHQLFKMDKDKMHKLMDNPSSSTKFEYAISSLITESQNSLNRHLRSVAEKSLYSSSSDFIHNDNNTIYEDTFMKQMQCLLDPQDTVLLEDIKPIVMAELSKVLQLEDYEHRFDGSEDQGTHYPRDDQSNYPYYEPYNYEEYPQERFYDQDQLSVSNFDNSEKIKAVEEANNYDYNQEIENNDLKPLFERRPIRNSNTNLDRRQSIDSQRLRRSTDIPEEPVVPLFDSNTEQFSEEEDPFAELDKQYHVAVDHNFITIDDLSCNKNEVIDKIDNAFTTIKHEIDTQIQSIAESPLKLFSTNSMDGNEQQQTAQSEEIGSPLANPSHPSDHNLNQTDQKQEHPTQHKEIEKSENSNSIKTTAPSKLQTRKRSIDQRPSHRKEKRKKSESCQDEMNKQILNKDTANNVSDPKSVNVVKPPNLVTHNTVDLFAPKDDTGKEILKDNKKIESADKGYSDKYVKRKETPKKSKEIETSKKRSSSSSSHSIVSPKDNAHTTSQTPTKADPKIKLKPIDMFVEQSKKVAVHHSHRNTATNPTTPVKPIEVNKPKPLPQPIAVTRKPGKAVRRSVAVQVIRKVVPKATQTIESKCVSSRFSQTEKNKCVPKLVQTDPVSFAKSTSKANDAFERMKEIDLEIQVLLQEKFKLYSSLESKDSCTSSMPTLGMTVLNVTPYDDSKEDDVVDCDNLSADAIVDEFTNIPVEELRQIALESIQGESDVSKPGKRSVVQKLQRERKKSESPSTKRNKKSKPPNISLLEQIITDDRPLEDIISLDDLESTPVKSKRRPPKSRARKKITKKAKAIKYTVPSSYVLKECTVVLVKTDISTYLNETSLDTATELLSPSEPMVMADAETDVPATADTLLDAVHHTPNPTLTSQEQKTQDEAVTTEMVVESVVNDLQFDMLDVSEDIVIGDNCEIKSSEDKGHERVTISEEIILDNSQSSCDDACADSGQIESVCKTYDYSTDENLRRDSVTVSGHADAVLAIECVENDFIAACLDGNVYHFSGDGQLLNTLRGSNLAVTCLTIVKEKYETTVYTGSLDSRIRYYDLETGLEKGPECNVLSPIQTMDRAWDTIFVGTRTGFVLQFECKNNMLIPVSTVKFSEQSILALRALKEGPRKVLLVAARSENVTIKDAQTGLLLRTLVGPKMTVYTLLFEDGKVYCGTSSHQIHVFDYSSGTHAACHEGGKGAVCLRATGGLLFAGCYDGCVYVYREGEPRPLAQLRGPSLMLLSLTVVGSKIIAGYKDRSLYIWKIPLSILQEMIL